MPEQPLKTPRVLGVDDFAFRKSRCYGTILVDLERHRVIDLLPDRRAETLAAWLQDHPDVEIITRDRSTEYGRGITLGAPHAQQVADRFHIVANLREALERQLDHHRTRFVGIQVPRAGATAEQQALEPKAQRQPALRSPTETRCWQLWRQQRQALFEQVRQLFSAGETIRSIAQQLSLSRTTVYRYLRTDSVLIAPQRKVRPSILDEYLPYWARRWAEGWENAAELWREIKAQGYSGSYRMVSVWAGQQVRQKPNKCGPRKYQTPEHLVQKAERMAERAQRAPSSKLLSYFLMRRPDSLNQAETAVLQQIRQASPDAEKWHDLVQEFLAMVHKESSEDLDEWLGKVAASGLVELQNFAVGLERDKAAVLAGLREEWSNGQVEGQVNRLKLIKREMYGRAGFALLRKRVLDAA